MSWWSDKLGQPQQQQQPQQRPSNMPPMPPSQQPMTYAPQAQPQQGARPTASANASRCPGCGSGNYGSVEGTKPRCYDCGYPLVQSGSGLGKGITSGTQGSGPVQPAIQIANGGWNPTTIIGKLG